MKVSKLLIGQAIASLGIAMVLNAGLGVFPVSATNLAVVNWFGGSYGVANSMVEICMMLYAMWRGERIGWATLLNGFLGGFIVDGFCWLLPHTWQLAPLGMVLLPLGYGTVGSCGLGENGSCMFQTALQKQFNKSTGFIRNVMEVCFLIVGLLGARSSITWFSIMLSVTFGTVMNIVYRVIKYDPTKVKQNYIKLGLTKRIQ